VPLAVVGDGEVQVLEVPVAFGARVGAWSANQDIDSVNVQFLDQ
jgi:hypothetical protein